MEETATELGLQLLDHRAERGLALVQPLCSLGEASGGGDADEAFELPQGQIHEHLW
jgi:hypothetical protein